MRLVDQLICISDIYLLMLMLMSTDKYKRHSRAICYSEVDREEEGKIAFMEFVVYGKQVLGDR